MGGGRRDLFEPLTGAGDFLEDGLDAGSPHERCRRSIPSCEKLGGCALKIAYAVEDTSPDGLLGEFGEPTLNEVEPTRTGGDEVQHKPRMPSQPTLNARVPVSAIVIEDQVQGLFGRKLGVEPLEKLQELLMSVPGITLADHPTFDDLQGGKQRRGAVSMVVVRVRATTPEFERQTGLGAIQSLNLTLLIDAQHDRVLRGRQVDPDHIGELLQKLRITGELEAFAQMRLQPVILPGALNRVFADPLNAGHRARAPVRRTSRLGLKRGVKIHCPTRAAA